MISSVAFLSVEILSKILEVEDYYYYYFFLIPV